MYKQLDSSSNSTKQYRSSEETTSTSHGFFTTKTTPLSHNVTAQQPTKLLVVNPMKDEADAFIQQKERQERLRNVCFNRAKEYNNSFHDHFSISGKVFGFHEDIYLCRAFKSATTFSIGLLSKLFKCDYDCYVSYAQGFADKRTTQKREHIKDTFSFFFVREPYQRLFSVYSNKFYLTKENWAPVGPEIAAEYRNHPSETSLRYGHDVTFRELIQYVVDAYEQDETPDKHVIPDYKLCNPCYYRYTFIGKLESFTSDWNYLIDSWTALNYTTPLPDEEMKELLVPNVISPIKHLYVTKHLLLQSGIPVINLFRRTWGYYQIIGLISKTIEMPISESSVGDIELEDFTHIIQTAIEESKGFGKEVKAQKREALLQAYASVSDSLLKRLRIALSMDCELFGYEDRPSWVFENRSSVDNFDHNYFRWL